jgi:hypothetical protein
MSNDTLSVPDMVDKSAVIDGTVGALLGLTWVSVLFRIYVRSCILKKVYISDYFIVLTQVWPLTPLQLPGESDVRRNCKISDYFERFSSPLKRSLSSLAS